MARAINLLIDVRNLTDEKQPARHGPGRTSPARRGADLQSAMLAEWLAFLDELLSYSPRQERVASVGPLSRYPADWLARNLTVQAKDKLIDFDAGRPGCGHLRESPLSRLLSAFCLNSERASALYNIGVHWSPVGFHWPPPASRRIAWSVPKNKGRQIR